ncbi:transketolase [Pseudacidobacterium ailaaui]|uniref:transketolase n=1 Tax=Pseudacidobacterium ailaaui TaxID=1382359 RepID=UPI0005D19EBA|nr:transketolase [Pseudacidobacterium ailaaui]MBX6359182.1 transketolase [Pseudacidobacterium ailaaui]MDI3255591.1 transketolase [Bacillota bacterium]
MSEIDQLSINTLRFLAVDAVEKAKSGHPGAPLGDAPMAYLLFHKYMRHNPANSHWSNRDRFVLSNGHASALLYGLLHLSGYKVSLEDLQQFRQWGSNTPGHPERGDTDGVEVTTGPLGQGFAMGVGLAAAEKHLAAVYNRPGFDIVDHYTYGICSDGDLMEGISHEAASLAGTLGLGKLIYLYDDNLISLDGPTDLSYTEDVLKRFEAYHWHVQMVQDGNDLEALGKAIEAAKAVKDKPSLIAVRTIIGYGSPLAGTNKVHGEAMGAENVKKTKEALGWPADKTFYVPEEARKNWLTIVDRGKKAEAEWNALFAEYKKQYPELAAEFERTQAGKLREGWEKTIPVFPSDKPVATRNAGNVVMNAIAKQVPELIGGAADLTASTKTIVKDGGNFHLDAKGVNIWYGVREFGMCAIVNGMAAHGGVIPYGSTFFVFTDYAKPALRMAAIMHVHSLFIFTHDSIALGEDGPTHQPIEHLMALRAVPHLTDFRPADANETAAAWRLALERNSPSFMALSRQDLPVLDAATHNIYDGVKHGAYIVEKGGDSPDLLIVATGSELWPALEAATALKKDGITARVVSMPSWKLFEEQSEEYKSSIFPDHLPKLAVEAGSPIGWWKYVGRHGDVIGLERFGASAPGKVVLEKLGFSATNIAARGKALLDRVRKTEAAMAGK